MGNKIKGIDSSNLNFSKLSSVVNNNPSKAIEKKVSNFIEDLNISDSLNEFLDALKRNVFNKYYIYSISSNETNQFGANQGNFYTNNAKLLEDSKIQEIIKSYFPEATIEQMEELLFNVNTVGCGYAALTNSIFAKYTGKEEEFEETFGFPMYTEDENGNIDFNYEYLMLDIFCFRHKDNSAAGTNLSPLELTLENSESYIDFGADDISYFQEYLKEKNINCSANIEYFVSNEKVYNEYYSDAENYHKFDEMYDFIRKNLQEGENELIVNVGGSSFGNADDTWTLYDYTDRENSDKAIVEPGNVGHAMSIIGITNDNNLIVSSWGKEYILEVSDESLLKSITVVNL